MARTHDTIAFPDPINPAVRKREFESIAKLLEHPLTQPRMDDWVRAAGDRHRVAENMFFGRIRWPKSIGCFSGGSLAGGFTFKLQNHFTIHYVGAGGEDVVNDGHMDMPPPTAFDLPDDDQHYNVAYGGYYAIYNLYIDQK